MKKVIPKSLEPFTYPNVREMFIPSPGHVICECDLSGADAQVVAWEADDEELKTAFRNGMDVHTKNGNDILSRLKEPLILDPKGKDKKVRDEYKSAVHGTNYGGSAAAIANHERVKWPISKAKLFQRIWLDELHPNIRAWHRRTERDLLTTRTVRNAFGFHRVYFDRPDGVLPQALAWVPQSTVALVSFKGGIAVQESSLAWVRFLLQVHDSVVFEIPKARIRDLPLIRPLLNIPVPYPDPLIIPCDIKLSDKSWGACKNVSWESLEGDTFRL